MNLAPTDAWSLPFQTHFQAIEEEEEKNLYRTSLAYQIPGFYSDDDENDEDKPFAPQDEEIHVPISCPDKKSFSIVRKRSMTNSFTARPPHTSTTKPELGHNQVGTASHVRKPLDSCPVEPLWANQTYLSLARKKLAINSRRKFVILGYQPIVTTISPQEKRDCFQKIWIHQMNRSEAQHNAGFKFEVIPEEE